uniref:Uncharacterized protein n=1 Tax=Psilocybe cubensis TaxID=181762 RepID=A0A8H7XPR3_PSICU
MSYTFPNSVSAKPIVLGSSHPQGSPLEAWWPTAQSDSIRLKLYRRTANEGNHVPIYIALCIGLVAAMYKTTAVACDSAEYDESVPLDYSGLVSRLWKGQAWGQDPEEHYNIYIQTLSNAE